MKHLAHRSQWLRHVRTITTTRIRLIQDHLRRIRNQVQLIRALRVLHQPTHSLRMQGHLELRPLPIRVLRVQHRPTIHQVTVRQRLLLRDQHLRIQHQTIALLLHLVRPLRARALLQALLQGQLLQVRDRDAKQDFSKVA